MTSETIGSYETKLELACHDRHPDGTPRTILATLNGPSVSASVAAYDDNYSALVTFFDDLTVSWRGWEGERALATLEGDHDIRATHEGHIRLSVRMRRVDGLGDWNLYATFKVEPGEDISTAAADVRALVGRFWPPNRPLMPHGACGAESPLGHCYRRASAIARSRMRVMLGSWPDRQPR